jgi:plastocyanin
MVNTQTTLIVRICTSAVLALIFILSGTSVFAHTVDEPGTHTIHMDAEGYSPERLEINQGDTVIFENVDTRERWPASNIHPTHTVYPGSDIAKCGTGEHIFDACRGLEPGEEFAFTFNKPGRWRFHDHIWPQLVGEIVVHGSGEIEEEKLSLKDRFKGWVIKVKENIQSLYLVLFPGNIEEELAEISIFQIADDEEELKRILRRAGPERVMERLLTEADGGSTIDCHQPAHQVGRMSYEVFGASVFEKGDASCHSGYYHGAMESFLAERGTENLAANISELCSVFETNFGIFECLHGVGHGVMAYENYDLMKSLEGCEALNDAFSTRSCYGGVFMENVVAGQGLGAIPGHETTWVSDDPHFPCNAVGDSFARRHDCYQMQTSWMLTLMNYDFSAVVSECQSAPVDMISVCFKSLGRDAAGHTLRNPERILDICSRVPDGNEYYNECIVGAVNVIIDFWGPKLGNQAHEFCELVPKIESKDHCFSLVENRLPDLRAGR